MEESVPKKVRCTCVRCGKITYERDAAVDTTEPWLCASCDDIYVGWHHEAEDTAEQNRRTLEAFLQRRPAR